MVRRLGHPPPALNAALSAWTEFLGGLLIVLGLFTRLVSIPLFINMVVATLAVRLKKLGGLDEFVELDEPLYALTFRWLFFSGPGRVSLDHLLDKPERVQPGRPALCGFRGPACREAALGGRVAGRRHREGAAPPERGGAARLDPQRDRTDRALLWTLSC